MSVWLKYKHQANQYQGEVLQLAEGNVLDWKDMAVHKLFMKITRECHRHKTDNSVDLAGYAWTLEEATIENERRRNPK